MPPAGTEVLEVRGRRDRSGQALAVLHRGGLEIAAPSVQVTQQQGGRTVFDDYQSVRARSRPPRRTARRVWRARR